MPLSHGYTANSRSLGIADMANALRSGRQPRVNGDLTYHVLEVMHAFHTASEMEKTVRIKSKVKKPEPFSLGLTTGYVDP